MRVRKKARCIKLFAGSIHVLNSDSTSEDVRTQAMSAQNFNGDFTYEDTLMGDLTGKLVLSFTLIKSLNKKQPNGC